MKSHIKWDRLVLLPCLSVMLFFLANRPCFGQAAAINGQIEGTITDPQGAVVPNAKVEIVNLDTGFKRTGQTDETGFYRFPLLPLGTYEVNASSPAFATVKRSGIVLNAGTTASVNIALALAQVSKEITVSAAAPVVEPGRTDIGSTLDSNLVTNLPLVSRNNFNFILLQPNVSGHPNTEFGVPRKVNANGFVDRINYQLDGSNNTESDRGGIRLMPISNTWIEEVQQVNNGFAPEFGNSTGTVFNSVTKSGTNTFHGEAAYIFRRTDFVARNTLLKTGDKKPILNLDDGFADVGGPVIKDKLFFFGSFERIKRDLPMPVTVQPSIIAALGLPASYAQAIPFNQNVNFVLGKADYQINSANRLSFRFNYFRNESPYNASNFVQQVITQTFLFHDRAPSYAVQLISAVSSRAVNEFRFQFPKRDQRQVAFTATGPQPVLVISGQINFGGTDQAGVHFVEKTPEISDNFSYAWRTHNIRFGGDVRFIRDDNVAATFARYTFANVADYLAAKNGTNPKSYTNFTQVLGNPELKYNSVFGNFFVQDNWKVRPNVTLTYGVRYDVYKIPSANSASLFAASQKFKVDKNNFAPRLGIAYAMGKDQKTVFRLNGGIFYDAPQTDIYRRALLNNGQPQFFNLSTGPTTSFAPAFPTILTALPSGFNLPVQDITTVYPNFRSLYSSNFNAQVSREITANLGLNISYLYTKGTHIPVYRNINLIPGGTFLADGRPIFGSARIDPRFNNIQMAESVGNSVYNGLNITVNRRFAQGLDFFVTYTWSHAIDNAPEQNLIDTSTIPNLPEDPTNLRRERGNSSADRRHVVTTSGSWQPSFTIGSKALSYLANNNRLALVFPGGSGDIFNMGSNRNLNNDPTTAASQQRPLFIGRNTIRGPYIAQVDMRYARIFPIRERLRPEFFAEFTNLFNHSNYTGINSTATVDAAGNILAAPSLVPTNTTLDSRLMQLGIKLTF